ncbi:hypothetical protein [Streptococcus pyogenes]|uniref:hypothetical protein n=1 Tax=Streptococcus pyogenes TaxID=1314 RepID=UPI0010D44648|nr:hypothetical protein [Streptococcus pyogenes]VHA37905.1 Uncharacterised protein [Streptococcus pyogenes]VHG15994.1 Uncharacterised protein [Streptococcus pyogenes]VHI12419.1 Uncharacterised protein [Streptococcus pyogenes]VHK01302.1 Uncharacterised protein [Streptococcus pyogenes]
MNQENLMLSYHVSNHDRNFLIKIEKQQYEDFKKYNTHLKKYTNIFDCYQNYKNSKAMIEDYIRTIDGCDNRNLNEIYRNCKYLFVQNIMFGRMFIDNIKSYCKQLNRFELKREISNFESLDEFKMLKLLRDYAQHFSLPFSNLRTHYSPMEEKTTGIEPLISTYELNQNKNGNKQNTKYLKTIDEDEISIVVHFEKWSETIDKLFLKVKNDFLLLTDSHMKQFIVSNILCFIGVSDFIPVGLAKATQLNNHVGMYQTKEFIPFDELVLIDLFFEK